MNRLSEADRAERIKAIGQQIENNVYQIGLHLNALTANSRFLSDLGIKLMPEPKPPTKAERTQECIRDINQANDAACAMLKDGHPHDWCIFRSCVWKLLDLLTEDDCDWVASGFQTRIAAVMEADNRLGRVAGSRDNLTLFRGRVCELIEFCRQHVAGLEHVDHAK